MLGQEFKAGTLFQHKHRLPEGLEIRGSHGELIRGPGNRDDGLTGTSFVRQRGERTLKPGLSLKVQQLQSAEGGEYISPTVSPAVLIGASGDG